jgi:hypothetical protein
MNSIINFKKTLDYLYDGVKETNFPLLFIVQNYKRWHAILNWLVKNEIKGVKLVEFFKNESKDGGGFHSGITLILSRIDGKKHNVDIIKASELK